MTISQTFLDKGKYLLVSLEGTRPIGRLQVLKTEMANHCRQHGITQVILDTSQLQDHLSLLNWFELGQLGGLSNTGIRKLAVVNGPHIKNATFAEDVAANRGFLLKVFADLDAAEQWILT